MNNTALQSTPISSVNRRPVAPIRLIDISRGARNFGIRSVTVLIDGEVIDSYREVDEKLGHNLIGVILSVLGCHLSMAPGGIPNERISISAVRREDAVLVDIDFQIRRSRSSGGERLVLSAVAERESDIQFA